MLEVASGAGSSQVHAILTAVPMNQPLYFIRVKFSTHIFLNILNVDCKKHKGKL